MAAADLKSGRSEKLVLLITPVVTLGALVVPDPDTFLADSNIPDNEIITGQIEVSTSLASATITIMMYGYTLCITWRPGLESAFKLFSNAVLSIG